MARFISKLREPVYIIRPQDRTIDEQRHTVIIPGKRAEFFNHELITQDQEVIDYMRKHIEKGTMFDEVLDSDMKPKVEATPIATGAVNSLDIRHGLPQAEVPNTRPTDITEVSPVLLDVIDQKINAAFQQIVTLLKKDEAKEEAKKANKPTKIFHCPYCKEPFNTGFAVGDHKKTCEKRPKTL